MQNYTNYTKLIFRSSASEKLEKLATETGGTVFFIADDGTGFSDAFEETTTLQPGSTLGRAQVCSI